MATKQKPGAVRGRPRKPKPPPRPAHRPSVPFLEHKGRYRIAAFISMKVFTRSGATLFAAIKYGERLDIDAVPRSARAEILRQCLPDADPLIFGARNSTSTKAQPNSRRGGSSPGTLAGGERTLHDQVAKVWASDDEAAKCWLANMAFTFMFAQISAYAHLLPPERRPMFFDSLRSAIMLRAGDASDQGEREWALENIVPAIDRAVLALPQ